MPKEKDTRKGTPENPEETENKKDDAKSKEEEIDESDQEEANKESEEGKEDQTMNNEFDNKKANLKSEIKENLDKAIEFQKEIKELTGRTLEELEKMSELSKKIEEFYQEAGERVESLEKDLEEKAVVPEGEKPEEEGVDFEQLLSKAKEIKELLKQPEVIKPEEGEKEEEKTVEVEISSLEAMDETIKMKAEEKPEEKPLPEEKEEPGVEEAEAEEAPVPGKEGEEAFEVEISSLEAMDETIKMKAEERPEEKAPPEEEEPGIEEAQAEEAPVSGKEGEEAFEVEVSPLEAMDETLKMKAEERPEEKPLPEEKREPGVEEAEVSGFPKRRASDAIEILEKYKKAEPPEEDAEVYYYENNDKKILDSECIISALSSHLEEAEKLYKKLSKTDSPIDQFFVKQEIIRSQEALRGIFLTSIRMLEKESCTLPQYTIEVLNMDVIKETLEKLSMQNWSKHEDFNLFSEYAKKTNNDFYARISPLVNYLKSIIDELGLSF